MILFGIPTTVQRFFARVGRHLSRPIRVALPVMVLALLLAPHRRCLKTIAGAVLGDRVHASTISRRLRNANWRTRDWYVDLHDDVLLDIYRWERQQSRPPQRRKRRWTVIIDTTLKGTRGHRMENLLLINARANPQQRPTRHHAFVMGVMLTEYGFRIPLPRRSYYTGEYCARHKRTYRTQVQLAALMLRELWLPDDVEVVVLYDSYFDANDIHRVCRERGFIEVFPIDPNRTLSAGPEVGAAGIPGQKVVHWTRTWTRDAFAILELQYANENHVFWRRRHGDNLRLRKTFRRYAAAACQANVSRLGRCVIVASYKENPSVAVGPDQAADWWSVHTAPVRYQRHERQQPQRWQAKVLACTDAKATARQVVEWYEVRWQIELFFRELKSRMQLGGYVLHRFDAVERYLDLVLMGMLLLEHERLREFREVGPPDQRGGEAHVQARTTDRLRSLEAMCHAWNVEVIEQRLRSERGRRQLLQELRQVPCHVP
jgi:Transposase DDE domain